MEEIALGFFVVTPKAVFVVIICGMFCNR